MATVESVSTARLLMDSGMLIVPQLNVSGIPDYDSGFYQIRGEIAAYLHSNGVQAISIEKYVIDLGNNETANTDTPIAGDLYLRTWTTFTIASSKRSDPYLSLRNSGGSLLGLFYGTNGTGYPYSHFVALKDITNNPAHDKIAIVKTSNSEICISSVNASDIYLGEHLNSDLSWVEFDFVNTYPITYRPTNCSFPNAPTEAAVGENVVVPVTFPDGYGLVNESNIYVTNNGVVISSTYSNGQLTFTMPDPS